MWAMGVQENNLVVQAMLTHTTVPKVSLQESMSNVPEILQNSLDKSVCLDDDTV